MKSAPASYKGGTKHAALAHKGLQAVSATLWTLAKQNDLAGWEVIYLCLPDFRSFPCSVGHMDFISSLPFSVVVPLQL